MNSERIIAQLQSKYPGKTIVQLPPENPTEIICEIDPTTDHPEYSTAIAVIDSSHPHLHRKTTETYEVLQGEVTLRLNDNEHVMKEGEIHIIRPNTIHSAQGDAAWVKVTSTPGWNPEDHILVSKDS